MADLNAKLKRQLECPVCLETCSAPIYMCVNGHPVCAACQQRLDECSTCRAPGKPRGRCIPLEKLAEEVEVPCPKGCNVKMRQVDVAKHAAKCGFKCRICQQWKKSAVDIKNHVLQAHSAIDGRHTYFSLHSSGESSKTVALSREKEFPLPNYIGMFEFNGDLFWWECRNSSAKRTLTRSVRVVSHDPAVASRYCFSVEIRAGKWRSKYTVFHQADVLAAEDDLDGENNMVIVLPAGFIDANVSTLIEHEFKMSKNY